MVNISFVPSDGGFSEDDMPEYVESDDSKITVKSGFMRINEEEFLELSKPKITK